MFKLKIEVKLMSKRKLKKEVIYIGYGVIFLMIVGLIYLVESSISKKLFETEMVDYDYVTETIIDDEFPVVNIGQIIIRPYVDDNIKVVKSYYDYLKEKNEQERAIIYHENTYYQNSGVDYSGQKNFEVVAILDGEIIEVIEDALLGFTIEIKHNNEIISTYQSLSEVMVKKDDVIKQGEIIGKSGSSNFSKELGDRLHFELIYKGQVVNPEEYYEKEINDL